MATLERAIQIAAFAHRGQKDKAGNPYILHPLRIMLKMDTLERMMIAVLHDVIEDSHWTLGNLRDEGFSPTVIKGVDALTRRRGERYQSYIERVKRHPLVIPIKLGDLEDNMNMLRLKEVNQKDLERMKKYHWGHQQLTAGIKPGAEREQ